MRGENYMFVGYSDEGKRRTSVTFFAILLGIVVFFACSERADAAIIRMGVVKTGILNVRKGPGTTYGNLKIGSKTIQLKLGQTVSINDENSQWYKIVYTYNKKIYNGYVEKKYVQIKLPKLYVRGRICTNVLNVRTAASISSSILTVGRQKVQLVKNQAVNIYHTKGKWYDVTFRFKSKAYTGYVSKDYVTTVKYTGVTNASGLYVRVGADTSKQIVKVGNRYVKLPKSSKVNIIGFAGNWYKIECVFNKKSVTGYVYGSYIKNIKENKVTNNIESGNETISSDNSLGVNNKVGVTMAKGLNVRIGPSTSKGVLTSNGEKVVLSIGTTVTVIGQNGDWYNVAFAYKGKNLKGYVSKKYVKVYGIATGNINGCYGIDVSQYQGTIDWRKVKASGVDFAIIRATKYSSRGEGGTNLVKDSKFDVNMKNAIAAGVKVGTYVYSYANSKQEAINEAKLVIKYVKGYKLTYPIYYDIEEPSRAKSSLRNENTSFSIAFCEEVKDAGYKPGVYSGASFFVNCLNISELSPYDIWVARYIYTTSYALPNNLTLLNAYMKKTYMYNTSNGQRDKYNSIIADMWQFSSNARVNGISGRIDMNYSYKCY